MVYTKQLTILKQTKKGFLYSPCQGTNVGAVPSVIRTPKVCSCDAHLILNLTF